MSSSSQGKNLSLPILSQSSTKEKFAEMRTFEWDVKWAQGGNDSKSLGMGKFLLKQQLQETKYCVIKNQVKMEVPTVNSALDICQRHMGIPTPRECLFLWKSANP